MTVQREFYASTTPSILLISDQKFRISNFTQISGNFLKGEKWHHKRYHIDLANTMVRYS